MPGRIMPLQYEIDDWHQLPGARSNADPTLRIKITDFIHSAVFEGLRIQVRHPQYGILFSCIVNTSGRLTSYDPNACLEPDQILTALRQLGFEVKFKTKPVLNQPTIEFLEGCLATGYTHIRRAVREWTPQRIAYTADGNDYRRIRPGKKEHIIICFNEDKKPFYTDQCIKPIRIFDGDVMEVSPNENTDLDFSWLPWDKPIHIESILTR